MLKREKYIMPQFIKEALTSNDLFNDYKARPAYQKNDYIGWITRAKLARPNLNKIHFQKHAGVIAD